MNTNDIKSNLIRMEQGPKKSLGQHFLTSEAVVKKMVEAAKITKEDTILEIGPGLGILTRELVASPAKRLFLCEKDHKLCDKIKGEFIQNKVKVICDDALLLIPNLQVESPARSASNTADAGGPARSASSLPEVATSLQAGTADAGGPFKVISNLPYNVGAPILISLLTICPTLPQKIVVMLQKEVAQRICAKPGNSNRGLLTVLIELYGNAKIIEKVPRNLFYPAPQVDSAVLLIDDIKPIDFNPKAVIRIIKMAFAGKRKKLKNSIFSTLKITAKEMDEIAKKAGLSSDQRPEDLNRDQWMGLIEALINRT